MTNVDPLKWSYDRLSDVPEFARESYELRDDGRWHLDAVIEKELLDHVLHGMRSTVAKQARQIERLRAAADKWQTEEPRLRPLLELFGSVSAVPRPLLKAALTGASWEELQQLIAAGRGDEDR